MAGIGSGFTRSAALILRFLAVSFFGAASVFGAAFLASAAGDGFFSTISGAGATSAGAASFSSSPLSPVKPT